MIEAREDLSLEPEAAKDFFRVGAAFQQLNRHLLLESIVSPLTQPDRARSTPPELAHKAVGTDPSALLWS
jgi:hypothetical protein